MPKNSGIGASSKRREDVRFRAGKGRFTGEITLAGQAHRHALRPKLARARIGAAEAKPAMPRIVTGSAFDGVGGIPCGGRITDRHGEPTQGAAPLLAQGTVRHVGGPIRAIIAGSRHQARLAAEAIQIDREERPTIIDMKAAQADGWADATFAAPFPNDNPSGEIEPGPEETPFHDPDNVTHASAAHVPEVEDAPRTGQVTVERFAPTDDFGEVASPMTGEGVDDGDLARGIGRAMLETCARDEEGQLLSVRYMGYAMPAAHDVPMFSVDARSDDRQGLARRGEAGAIGAPPTIVKAVTDALQSGGHAVGHIDMPLTPSRLWAATNAANNS